MNYIQERIYDSNFKVAFPPLSQILHNAVGCQFGGGISYISVYFLMMVLTAGSAKNEIANTEKHEATILPIHVCGTVSPYPIVVTVI